MPSEVQPSGGLFQSQFTASRRSSQPLNLTPLIDIVFLLLVFFMLTAHFVQDQGLPVELPEANSALSLDNDKPIELLISSTGEITYAGEKLMPEHLHHRLSALLANRSDKRVMIRGDAGASLGDSIKVLDAARQAGASGVDIVTRKPGEQ